MKQYEIIINVQTVEEKLIPIRRKRFKLSNLFRGIDCYDLLLLLICIIMISAINIQKHKVDNIIEKTEKLNIEIQQIQP